jgi:CHAT domain-containing protein
VRRIRDRIAVVSSERSKVDGTLEREFPAYANLANPVPMTVLEIRSVLSEDEALVAAYVGQDSSFAWVITKGGGDWKQLEIKADEVSNMVAALRTQLQFDNDEKFNPQLSFDLFRRLFGSIETEFRSKSRLSFVFSGALTSLPPNIFVTEDPSGKTLQEVDWLIRSHALTSLPAVGSLKVLRGKEASSYAPQPLIGFADPIFETESSKKERAARLIASLAAANRSRGQIADTDGLVRWLRPLPETADELRRVAASVNASNAGVILGPEATETKVKNSKLNQFRIVYFATHSLVSGAVEEFAKLHAEPALVLTLPDHPTELDDGLLTASEVAQLKLNAEWVVLSACNTASEGQPGAEALSGLARAFFYAGGRSLLVSHWAVETQSAVELMAQTFANIASDPNLSHAEALQQSILTMINNPQHPAWVDPKYWAPFVVVGEPDKGKH